MEIPIEAAVQQECEGSPRLRSGQALRLRGWFASRTSRSAQDDRVRDCGQPGGWKGAS